MKYAFTKKFLRQVDKVASKKIKAEIMLVIDEVEQASDLLHIRGLKKLSGYRYHYRIRVGDYRIGLYLNEDSLEFTAFDNRKDIYKYFP